MPSMLEGAPASIPPYPATVEKNEIESNIPNSKNASTSNDVESREQDEEVVYPGHLKFGLLFAALCVAVFQVVLDEVVVATDCTSQLLFGKLYSMLSVKLVFLTALVVLELGSIICALAPNSIGFIFGRVIAGIGAGGILSGVLTIMSHSLPRAKLAPFNGILGAISGISFLCGPLVGGAIIAGTTWRWIFWINPIMSVPTFIATIFIVHLKPPKKSHWRESISKLDLPSFAIFLASIVCLLIALQWGGTMYAWKNARIVVLLILFGILLGAFIFMQIRKKDAGLVPLRIITRRSIFFGMMYSFCTSGAGVILQYWLPLWLQAIHDFSVIKAAVNLLPIIISAIVFNIISGVLVPVIGYYVPSMIFATMSMSVGMAILSTLKYDSPIRLILGYQVPAGVGIGVALQQTVLAAQTILPMQDVPIGVSLMVLAQTLGGTIALSAANTIFTASLTSGISSSIPHLDQSKVLNTGAIDLRHSVPPEYVDILLSLYSKAVTHTLYLSLALACFSIVGTAGMKWVHVNPPHAGKKTAETETETGTGADTTTAEIHDRLN
ncbi:hypothetical protein CJF32_00010731 [Rutstroemia sp. NJR-2017a WRK4]|nr:hypothetical protein CJF32_00010731 [Rutstroemia sp. NJR-2017a WRK4]